jgi:hypothetical protein
MRRVIVRYTVKPGQEGVNEKPVRVVYDELHQTQPTGLRYATFRLDDGRTFAHAPSTKPSTSATRCCR